MRIEKFGDYQLGDIVSIDNKAYIIGKNLSRKYTLQPLEENSTEKYSTYSDKDFTIYLYGRTKLLCNFICESSIRNSDTLYKKENGTITIEKILNYPINAYSHFGGPFSFNTLTSLVNTKTIRMAYYPNDMLLYDLADDNDDVITLRVIKAPYIDIPSLLSSKMLSYKEEKTLLNKYKLDTVKDIEIQV